MFSFLEDKELYGSNLAGEATRATSIHMTASRGPVQVGTTAHQPAADTKPPAPPQPPSITLAHFEIMLRALSSMERRIVAVEEKTTQVLDRLTAAPTTNGSSFWCTILVCLATVLLTVWLLRPSHASTSHMPTFLPQQLPAQVTSGVYLSHNGGPPTPLLLAAAPTSFLQPA